MPAIKDAVEGVGGSMEDAQKNMAIIAKALAVTFMVLELGVRGAYAIITGFASGVVGLVNFAFQGVVGLAALPMRLLKETLDFLEIVTRKIAEATPYLKISKEMMAMSKVMNDLGNAIQKPIGFLDKLSSYGEGVKNEFTTGWINDLKAMENASARWLAVIDNADKTKDLKKGKLPSTNPYAPEGDEDGKAGKAGKAGKEYEYEEPESGYKYALEKAEAIAKNHFAKMELIAVTADEKENLRYQQELYDFLNSSEAMYLSAEEFEERKTLLAKKHAALRKQIAADETMAQWDMYGELGQSLIDLGSEVTRASVKDARKQRDAQIAMAIVSAAGAAVIGVYKAVQDSESAYEAVIKAVAVVAAIAAVTIPQITSMQQQSFATGTSYAPGGMARVHKNETIFLPRGSQVATARESAQQPVNISVSFGGGVTKETLPDIKKTLRNLGNQIKYGIRGGMIRPSQIGLAPA